jgi:hypothetical protein
LATSRATVLNAARLAGEGRCSNKESEPRSGRRWRPERGVGVLRTFGILLILELALDDLGHGATAGALNPLDVLVILVGCQDCLQLRVCDLKESGFIWVYTSIYPNEIGSMMRVLGCDYILTSNQHHFVRSSSAHDNTNENSSPELRNTPNWNVGLTELQEKSIKNQIRGMNK